MSIVFAVTAEDIKGAGTDAMSCVVARALRRAGHSNAVVGYSSAHAEGVDYLLSEATSDMIYRHCEGETIEPFTGEMTEYQNGAAKCGLNLKSPLKTLRVQGAI
jgi:hypothetical protein